MEERDRIASARDADQVTAIVRQSGQAFAPPPAGFSFHGAAVRNPRSPSQGRVRLTTRLRPNGSIAFARMCSIASSTESVT